MDLILLVVAFGFGFAATRARLPALVGYLVAGFVLHAGGFESTEVIEAISGLGVQLLLFGIGLKLKIGTLARPEVWGTATIHIAASTAVFAGLLFALGALGAPMAAGLDIGQATLLGFVFAFSSTVFAVKTLEQKNEAGSLPGRLAVGVLVVQDVVAVGFLALSTGELPNLLAVPMVLLILALRPAFGWLLTRSGHGELLVLLGFAIALGIGARGFGLVGLKPELGALVAGLAVSLHPRAGEMSDRLLDLKDLFLVGFFLSIGLGGTPPLGSLAVVGLMLILIPFKSILFLFLFTRFRLRARTAFHSSLPLSTYSEFGLIVAAAGLAGGRLDQGWVASVAIAMAGSFAVAAAATGARYRLYGLVSGLLGRLERHPTLSHDAIVDCEYARVIIFGMGRIGTGAYDEIAARSGVAVVGVDRREEAIAFHESQGRNVIRGDALDRDFWDRVRFRNDVELIVICMDSHPSNLECVDRAKEFLPDARIAAIAMYPDQILELRNAGVAVARDLYEEAGQGLAEDAVAMVWERPGEAPDNHGEELGEPKDPSVET